MNRCRVFPVVALLGLALSAPSAGAFGPDELMQSLPSGGVRFATELVMHTPESKGKFIIAEVDVDGLRILADEDHSDYQSLLWLDHHTLLALGQGEGGNPQIHTYVDGRPVGRPLVVPASAWQLKDGEEAGYGFELLGDSKSLVWVGYCQVFHDVRPGTCVRYKALEVDVVNQTLGDLTNKYPRGARNGRELHAGLHPSKIRGFKAPRGFKVKLHKTDILDGSAMMGDGRGVPAFTCTSPASSATWPTSDVINWEFLTRPKKIRWVMAEPPIFIAEGPATNPIGETAPSWRAFRGCATQAMDDAVFTRHPVWFEFRQELDGVVVSGSHWVVNVGPVEVGRVPGSNYLFALAPE